MITLAFCIGLSMGTVVGAILVVPFIRIILEKDVL